MDKNLISLCSKERFIDILHNFMIYDNGTKKTCRTNQYFGAKAAQDYIKRREGGIIWLNPGLRKVAYHGVA